MKIIKPFAQLVDVTPEAIQKIERCGRICYRSEDKITDDSAEKFVRMIVKSGHHSVIEHASATFKFITNRGVSHELVRHRIASFSQSSTRYCNYSKDKFDNNITYVYPNWILDNFTHFNFDSFKEDIDLIVPDGMSQETYEKYLHMTSQWRNALKQCENSYMLMLKYGAKPQEARGVLPNDLMTEIIVTANFREWRTILQQRTSRAAHPDIRYLMSHVLTYMKNNYKPVFEDIIGE